MRCSRAPAAAPTDGPRKCLETAIILLYEGSSPVWRARTRAARTRSAEAERRETPWHRIASISSPPSGARTLGDRRDQRRLLAKGLLPAPPRRRDEEVVVRRPARQGGGSGGRRRAGPAPPGLFPHMNDSPANSDEEPSGASPASHLARASTAIAAPISATSGMSNAAPHAMLPGKTVATPFQLTPWSASASHEYAGRPRRGIAGLASSSHEICSASVIAETSCGGGGGAPGSVPAARRSHMTQINARAARVPPAESKY